MSNTLTRKPSLILAVAIALPGLYAEKRTTDRLIDQADAVVIGEVHSGQQTGYAVTFVLTVVRSIKGGLSPGATANVSWGCALVANKNLKGNYGLWFLRNAGGGQWTLLGVLQGQYPFEFAYFPLRKGSTPVSVSTSAPATVNDEAAIELLTALQSYTEPSQLSHLASGLLGLGESSVTEDLYRALRVSSDPETRFIGLAGLLRANDMSALAEIANNVNLLTNLHAKGFVTGAISSRRDADSNAIGLLGKVASSPDPALQGAAAEALKYIHTRDTLPYLAQLLNSNDARIREAAMIGLSRFVDNLPVQTLYNTLNFKGLTPQGPTPYRTLETDKYSLSRRWMGQSNEAEYLQFWKSWWVAMKNQLTATAP